MVICPRLGLFLFSCKYMVNLVEIGLDQIDSCIKGNGFKVGISFGCFGEKGENLVFVVFDG